LVLHLDEEEDEEDEEEQLVLLDDFIVLHLSAHLPLRFDFFSVAKKLFKCDLDISVNELALRISDNFFFVIFIIIIIYKKILDQIVKIICSPVITSNN
jgi:hypothetical protein